jgi:hypothetical protein
VRFSSSSPRPDWLWGPPSFLSNVKRLGREAHHSPLSSAEINNGGAVPLLSLRLHGAVLNLLSPGTTLPVPIQAEFTLNIRQTMDSILRNISVTDCTNLYILLTFRIPVLMVLLPV